MLPAMRAEGTFKVRDHVVGQAKNFSDKVGEGHDGSKRSMLNGVHHPAAALLRSVPHLKTCTPRLLAFNIRPYPSSSPIDASAVVRSWCYAYG